MLSTGRISGQAPTEVTQRGTSSQGPLRTDEASAGPSLPAEASAPDRVTLGSRRSDDPPADPAWTLAWNDEFNGPNGSPPDPAKWTCEVGGNGFGNHELEYYTSRPENVQVEDGNLVIQARSEVYTGPDGVTRNYTSARLTTPAFSEPYGRVEARIKIPIGQGMWPAFWMLGNDIETVGWPDCGEIDIMENVGHVPGAVHGSLHGPGYSGGNALTSTDRLPDGERFADDFHVFGVEWKPGSVRFFVDGKPYSTRTPASLPEGEKWVFDHPFFCILNVAVGGDWPGPPDADTVFPQSMQVDWVRAYRATPQDSKEVVSGSVPRA